MAFIGTVQTKSGKVTGIQDSGRYDGVTEFRGIPYAAPPMGDLRWRAPQDPVSWSGVRECTSYAPVCIQPTNGDLDAEPWATDFYYMGPRPMSEDCLYLNVATGAAAAGEKRAVYIWLHGGGPDHGYSYEVEFDPRELAKKGIVVVSVAQRLSAFGYLALPQLADENGRIGNYILQDDMKALQWVVDNIEAFGGDPDNITVGGQSAGTNKAIELAFCPLGRKYIKRVINESGLAWDRKYYTADQAIEASRKYLTAIGIDPDTPADQLRMIEPSIFLRDTHGVSIPRMMICDGDLIPDLSLVDTTEKYGVNVDYLSGCNLGEAPIKPGADRSEVGFTKASEYYDYMKELLGPLYDKYDFENLVKVTDDNVDRESRRLAGLGLMPPVGFRIGGLTLSRYFGQHHAEMAPGKHAFTYLFSRVAPCRPEDYDTPRDPRALMSWHSNELWYVFGSLSSEVPPARPWEAKDFELADIMSSYWANFIKTGDPNGVGLPAWPESDDSFCYAEIGDEIIPFIGKSKVDELILEFLDSHNVLPV